MRTSRSGVYQHPLGRTVTETVNTGFTLLTMNTAEAHFKGEVGKASEFGCYLGNSTLTLAIVAGQSVIDTSLNAIANLGWEDIRLTDTVFAGDALWSETVVLDKRESRSRLHAGVVRVKSRGLNQNADEVLSHTCAFLVYRQGHKATVQFPAKEPIDALKTSLA